MAEEEALDERTKALLRKEYERRGIAVPPGEETQGPLVQAPEARRLLRFFRRKLPNAQRVSLANLVVGAHGLSRDHFMLDLKWLEAGRPREEPLILIRDGDRPGQTDRRAEFRLLRKLEGTSIPAPRAFWYSMSPRWLDRPLIVMERVRGEVTHSFLPIYPDNPALREKLADEFVQVPPEIVLPNPSTRGALCPTA